MKKIKVPALSLCDGVERKQKTQPYGWTGLGEE